MFFHINGTKRYYNKNIERYIKSYYCSHPYVLINNRKNEFLINVFNYKKRFSTRLEKKEILINSEKKNKNGEYVLNELNEFVFVGHSATKQEGGSSYHSDPRHVIVAKQDDEVVGAEVGKNTVDGKHNSNDNEELKLEKLLKKRNIKKDILTITEEAKTEIKKIIENNQKENKNNSHVLKLFFITKGCNGLTHSFNFIKKNDIQKNDEIIYDYDSKKQKYIFLVIDSKCILYVINTTLDHYKDDLTEKFIFKNPNVTSICPCGTSFHF
ncbi:iron-sulfur assembly protein, putative [Hepatocystis sp. ex Piliocolobus tephrosceles]|nr:iron-sulfur assembly protein, putative [Hepatocystis sp. ex Piliocolobus tephrosceles]